MDYNIVWVRGHVEVYDWAGRFCFSADNEREALDGVKITVKEAVHTPAGWTASFIAWVQGRTTPQESMKLRIRSFTPSSAAICLQVSISSELLSLSTMVSTTWGTYRVASRAKSSIA